MIPNTADPPMDNPIACAEMIPKVPKTMGDTIAKIAIRSGGLPDSAKRVATVAPMSRRNKVSKPENIPMKNGSIRLNEFSLLMTPMINPPTSKRTLRPVSTS